MSTTDINLDFSDGVVSAVLAELGTALATLEGLPYLFPRVSYGNELTLHFGAERSFGHPKLTGKVRGTHVLSVRGSACLLSSGIKQAIIGAGLAPPSSKAKPFNPTALESGAFIGQGATIAHVTPLLVEPLQAIGLAVALSDGSTFTILPTPPELDSDDLPEPADWEVLTPTNVFRVGPGPHYTSDANVPRSQLG